MEGDLGKVRQRMVGPKDKLMGLHEKLAELKLAKNDLQEVNLVIIVIINTILITTMTQVTSHNGSSLHR